MALRTELHTKPASLSLTKHASSPFYKPLNLLGSTNHSSLQHGTDESSVTEGYLHEVSAVLDSASRNKYLTAILPEATSSRVVAFQIEHHHVFGTAEKYRTPVRIKNITFQPSRQKMGESDIIAGVQSKLCSLHNLPFPFDVTKRLQGFEQKTLADILADPVEYQRVHVTEGLGRMGEGDCHHQGQQNTEQDPVHHF
ncbi:hypothetical protein SRHO_G00340840 [Serrasalmus rhombeus]